MIEQTGLRSQFYASTRKTGEDRLNKLAVCLNSLWGEWEEDTLGRAFFSADSDFLFSSAGHTAPPFVICLAEGHGHLSSTAKLGSLFQEKQELLHSPKKGMCRVASKSGPAHANWATSLIQVLFDTEPGHYRNHHPPFAFKP